MLDPSRFFLSFYSLHCKRRRGLGRASGQAASLKKEAAYQMAVKKKGEKTKCSRGLR
jgi:hypothetical protein